MTHTQTPQTTSVEQYTGKNTFVRLHRNYPRVREYAIDRPFKLWLLGISQTIGITNAPSDELLNAIGVVLHEKYHDFTREEIAHAFMLYSTGEIGDEAGTGFGDKVIKKENSTFNAPFVCSVLNEYRVLRGPQLKRDERINASHQLQESNPVPYDQQCKEHYETYIKLINEHKRFDIIGTDWKKIFYHLEHAGEIIMTTEEKQQFKADLKNTELERLRARLDKTYYENQRLFIRKEIDRYNDELILQEICRKKICIEYLQQHHKI